MRHGTLLLAILLLTACASVRTAPVVGSSLADHGPYSLCAGDFAPDFAFVGPEHLTRFYAVRGDVTVLAFHRNPRWPDCEHLKRLVALVDELDGPYARVRMVSVGRPESHADVRTAIEKCGIASPNLVAITDRSSAIFDRYGKDAEGRFFVIGEMGRIAGSGEMPDVEHARALLAAEIDRADGVDLD